MQVNESLGNVPSQVSTNILNSNLEHQITPGGVTYWGLESTSLSQSNNLFSAWIQT